MLRYDTTSVMSTGANPGAMTASHCTPKPDSQAANGSERFVAAAAEAKNPTSVMATWMVAKNWPESAASDNARPARLSPSSASCCNSTCFALTSAISDMEKYPLTKTSTNVTTMLIPMSMSDAFISFVSGLRPLRALAPQDPVSLRRSWGCHARALAHAPAHITYNAMAKNCKMLPAKTQRWKMECM